ncbi:hypothetical protein EZV62_026311 [Acer yangbiense]|uniref:Autophagy-related protein n=1 Tax=Acer yangbiense TaxID=1000413 RepID=A0A5C7GRE4_9ROSI|nr:hypothetical protein EZV62_026311 [Acer yangbiense]
MIVLACARHCRPVPSTVAPRPPRWRLDGKAILAKKTPFSKRKEKKNCRTESTALTPLKQMPIPLRPMPKYLTFYEDRFSLLHSSRSVSLAMAKSSFKLEQPLERRQAESARIREKYADRIPVIVEKAERSDVPDIDKKKYLVPADLNVGQFVYVVRKRIKLSAEKAIFIFVNNTLPPSAALMSSIYEENKDEDGFLYMTYSGENTFGLLF